MTIQYSGAGRERLVTAVAATSDANGMITFRQGPCPLGFVWQGSVTVNNAPSGALLNATVASTPWGQWAGPTNFGPVQLWGNETLVVIGVGLLPSTQYSMLFFGVAMPEQMADPLPPVAPLSTVSVETTTLLVNGVTIPGGTGTGPTFQPPSLTRRLTIIIDATNQVGFTEIDVIGVQTGTVYTAINPTAGALKNPPFFCAIEPAVDTSYKISSSLGGGTTKVWVLASTTNPMIATNAAEPLAIVGSTVPGTNPVKVDITQQDLAVLNVAGSPVGTFQLTTGVGNKAVGNNQSIIAAPGAGLSIYLQSVTIWNTLIAAAALAEGQFTAGSGGAGIVDIVISPPNRTSETVTFPGGYKLPVNTGLFANVFTNAVFYIVTYAVGANI